MTWPPTWTNEIRISGGWALAVRLHRCLHALCVWVEEDCSISASQMWTCTRVTWLSCFWGSAFLTSELVLLLQEPLWGARRYNKWYHILYLHQVHGGLREPPPKPKIHQEVRFPVLSQIISDKCVSLVHFKFYLERFALQGEEKDKTCKP